MIRDKHKHAERLFDVIGMIDDSIIAECQEPNVSAYKRLGTSLRFRRFVSVCVSLAVICASLSAVLVISKLSNKKADTAPNDNDKGDGGVSDQNYEYRFDTTLKNAVSSSNTERCSLNEINFFDGEINLIWTDENTDGYYVLTLEESQEYIEESLKKGYSQMSANTSESESIGYTVWISYGNGKVVSPELKFSKGNVGYGELFEYSPEVVPGENLVKLVEKNAK